MRRNFFQFRSSRREEALSIRKNEPRHLVCHAISKLTPLIFSALVFPSTLHAALEIIPEKEPPFVFPGKRTIPVTFRNPLGENVKLSLQTRLYQASSATLAPIGEAKPWKTLDVLAGQTILEKVKLALPDVRTITTFELHWLNDTGQDFGKMKIRVCPDDLLKELGKLDETNSIGVLDPENILKPALLQGKVEFEDLEKDTGFDGFQGKLVLIGPFSKPDSVPDNLKKRIETAAKKTRAIVWMQPPNFSAEALLPFYLVQESASTVAIVPDSLVSNLPASPQAQLNLRRAARLAVNPDSLRLPTHETAP